MKKIYLYFTVLIVVLHSCNKIMCGELNGDWTQKIVEAEKMYPQFKIENIPCEFYYINLKVSNKIDTTQIDSLHKILYNTDTKIGWKVIVVYDKNGKYLFSHNFNNKNFIKKGD